MPTPQIKENPNVTQSAANPILKKSLRLWPGVVAVALQWLLWFVVPMVAPQALIFGMLGGLVCALAVVVWWLFFSRAAWVERIGAIVLMIVTVVLTKLIVHSSIAGGMMGMMLPIYSIPVLSLALVAAAAASRHLTSGPRRAVMIGAILLGCGVFTLIRTEGITGEARSDLHWRWTKTPEERLLAEAGDEPTTPTSFSTAALTPSTAGSATRQEADTGWPGFRGPKRDGISRGVLIETDWSRQPPVVLWRRPIGPGWSSFAVRGNLLYTQEQRGDNEVVSCYKLTTGEPVETSEQGTILGVERRRGSARDADS